MWISKVELHNIKSYGQRTEINLVQGVNAVCGQNGAGKSTILEAIGLTLFGKSSVKNQEQFVNEKAKKGEIVITLYDSRDERMYQVVRPVKGGSPYVYDPETELQVATGVNDVKQWLYDCMQVEPTTDLEALFENAIGVPQGMLTTSFLLTEANRRKVFDPLLRVEDYKQTFENLRPVVRHVEKMQADNEKKQVRCETQLTDLPALRTTTQDLGQEIGVMETELEQLIARLKSLEQSLVTLEQQKTTLGQLEQQHNSLLEQHKNLQVQLEEAENALEQARQAKATMDQCQDDYQAYEQAQVECVDLENQREARDQVRERLAQIDQELALVQQAIDGLETQLQGVAEAEARLTELEPLVKKQEELEQKHRDAEKAVAELNTARQRHKEEQERLEALRQELTGVQAQIEQRQALTQKIEQLQQRRSEQVAVLDDLNKEINDLEAQLADIRQALQTAQNRLTEYENLQTRIRETEDILLQRQNDLTEIQAEVDQRGNLEQGLQELTETRDKRKEEQRSLEEQIGQQETAERQTQAALGDWQSKAQSLEHKQINLEAAESRLAAAQAELSSLEQGVAQRHNLAEQVGVWEAEQAGANEQRDALKSDISRYETRLSDIAETVNALEVEADSPCPVCQKPLSGHDITSLNAHYQDEQEKTQAARQKAEANLKQTEKKLKQIKRQIKQARTEMEQLPTPSQLEKQRETVSTHRDEVDELQKQVAALEDAPEQVTHYQQVLEQAQSVLAELKQQQAALREAGEADEKRQSQLQQEINQLARPSDVDKLQRELEQMQADLTQWQEAFELLADAPQHVGELESTEQELAKQKPERQQQVQQVNETQKQLANEIDQHQADISKLASPDRVGELETDIEAQTETLTVWQDKVTGLSDAPVQLEAAADALKDLGDPRREQQTAQAEADKRPEFEAALSGKQQELARVGQTKTEIETELEPFANLDMALEQVKATLDSAKAAHQTYLEQHAIAEALPQQEAKVAEIAQNVETVGKKKDELQQQLTEARAAYDPADHQSTRAKFDQTRLEQTRLDTQLENKRQQLTEDQDKIAGLEAIEAELESLKQERERLSHLQEVIEFIRRTIKAAGPEVTNRLVKAVSQTANEIFADVMDDHQQELGWDETYGITVRRDGYERDFQQLSGGEGMAAALSVRLALLQSMSAVDVAFFDEPTANLDPERRDNLAGQIARIKGFSQLVVISHDDTFEQDTGNVIHIAKDEEGYSRVVD